VGGQAPLKADAVQLGWVTVFQKLRGWKENMETVVVRGHWRRVNGSIPPQLVRLTLVSTSTAELVTDTCALVQRIQSLRVLETSVL